MSRFLTEPFERVLERLNWGEQSRTKCVNWPFFRSPCFHTPPYRTTICFSVCLRRLAHWVSTPLGLQGFFNQENNINNITHVILCYSAFKQTYTHNYVLMCSTCLHINRKENKQNKKQKKRKEQHSHRVWKLSLPKWYALILHLAFVTFLPTARCVLLYHFG